MKTRKGFVSNSSSSSFVVEVPKDFVATKKMIEKCDDFRLEELFDKFADEDEEGINQNMVDAVNRTLDVLKSGQTVHRDSWNNKDTKACFWAVQELLEKNNHIVMVNDGPGGDGEDQMVVFKDLRKKKK